MTTFLDLLRSSGMTKEEWLRVVSLLDDRATRHEAGTPFGPGTKFFLWLTREEWQFAYCMSLAWQMAGEIATNLSGIDEEMTATIFKIEYDTGYDWLGVEFNDEVELVSKTSQAIEPRNMAWVVMLGRGQCPDLLTHFPEAIAYAEGRRELTRYVTLLEDTLEQIKRDLETITAVPPTYEEREVMAQIKERAEKEAVVN